MLGICQKAVFSGNLLLIPYISSCACQLPVARRLVDISQHGCNSCLVTARQYCSRYIQGLVSNKLRTAPPWRTVFFGTDEYALVHLKALNENR